MYRSDSLVQQGAVVMGYLAVPDGSDAMAKKEIDPELSLSAELQKCFIVLDFETRFLGILSGFNLEQVSSMPFRKIKGARSLGRSASTRQHSNNQSDGASNQSLYWTLDF